MRNLPADFIDAINADDAPVSMLVLKLESGDVKFSDGLFGEGLPYIENISEEQDGGNFENYLSRGNLETCKLSVTLLYSDLSRSTIHSVVSELQSMSADNLRCRAELWKKFVDIDGNDTCAPLLWNVYAVQDNSENFACREGQMLMPLELITLPGSENQKLSITDDQEKSYDIVIGKAEGLTLQFIEDESSKWTELLEDIDENKDNDLIKVKDATKLRTGYHLINGEYVFLTSASAGYMSISQRGSGLTEPQEHSSGSRIFPMGAVLKYLVCAGPVGILEKLRTSNEIDIYDDDGDGDTTEYKDLYSGGNEEYHPELNPAQIWFNDRMPWLKKDQDYEITDKVFYGRRYEFSSLLDVSRPNEVNKQEGNTKLLVSFRRFCEPGSDYWFTLTNVPLPALPGDGITYAASDNILQNLGYFEISQSFGEHNTTNWMDSTAYREMRIDSSCPPGEEGWTMIEPEMPDTTEFIYSDYGSLNIRFQRIATKYMDIRIDIYEVDKSGAEFPLFSRTLLGSLSGERDWIINGGIPVDEVFSQQFIDYDAYTKNKRIKLKLTCLSNSNSNSWAVIRVGGNSINYSEEFFYGMIAFWRYYDSAPVASVSSRFFSNMSLRGEFISAKIRVQGTLKNTGDMANGELFFVENDSDLSSVTITDGQEIDTTFDLSATSWAELSATTFRLQVEFDYLGELQENDTTWIGTPRSDGEAGIELTEGIQWMISYTGNNLDEVQVNYADQLYVDAVSTRGPDWTPARAVQYIATDHASWAGLIDIDSFDARHDEFVAAGHFLNGTISGSSGSQDAIRTVLREGLAGLNYPLGKITMYSYLTDLAAIVPVKSLTSIVRPDRESFPNRGFMQSANEMRSNRMFFRWNKNLSTGKYDGNVIKSDGTVFLNDQVVTFELVKSDIIGNSVANFLWNLWKYGYLIQDCEYPAAALAIEKHDLIESFSMADGDATANFIALSCYQTHESVKMRRGISAKIIMIKR